MGGLHSGRTRRHTCIDDCLTFDLARLRKQKLLEKPGVPFKYQWKKWKETDFVKRTEQQHHASVLFQAGEHPTLTFSYHVSATTTAGVPMGEQAHRHTIHLVSTPCNYGGQRYWFLAPCCGSRVRVLYVSLKGDIAHMTPQCRNCLELHYASQMQSYIEHHKTYERHLLANYGLDWASHRYNYELKTHYLEMTPELEAMRLRSELDQHIKMLRLLMSINRLYQRAHVKALNSLRSEDDRWIYTLHILKEWGVGHVEEVAQRLWKPEARQTVEEVIAAWIAAGKKSDAPLDLAAMIARKQQLEEELEELEKAA